MKIISVKYEKKIATGKNIYKLELVTHSYPKSREDYGTLITSKKEQNEIRELLINTFEHDLDDVIIIFE